MKCLAYQTTNKGAKRCPLRAQCQLYKNAIETKATTSDVEYVSGQTCEEYVPKEV